MMHDIRIEQASLNDIAPLRSQHLEELFQPQELFLELKVRKSSVYRLSLAKMPVGYVLLDELEQTLLEYYVTRPFLNQVDAIFGELLQRCGIRRAFCKSFDHTLLSCCLSYQKSVRPIGISFREYAPLEQINAPSPVRFRLANANDIPLITSVNEEIFESDEEIRETIGNQNMFLFEQGTALIGFGIFQRNIAGRPDFDIGMLVTKPFRRQGYGAYIIRFLTEYCQQNDWRPICGCAIENIASRRTLEKVGYIARHRLLLCEFA